MEHRPKSEARQIARKRRSNVSHASAGQDLIQTFRRSGLKDKCVAGFAAIEDEINLWPLLYYLNKSGCEVSLPVVTGPGKPLGFRRWTPEVKMKLDIYGVSYPAAGESVTPQLVLVPLLAFTPDGQRLGYGGGYYDRTLAKLRRAGDVFACGIAYAGQEVADVPTDQHDERLDGILTEKEFRVFK